jgi:hypothetical protein
MHSLSQKKIGFLLFTIALFTTAELWNQAKSSSVDK